MGTLGRLAISGWEAAKGDWLMRLGQLELQELWAQVDPQAVIYRPMPDDSDALGVLARRYLAVVAWRSSSDGGRCRRLRPALPIWRGPSSFAAAGHQLWEYPVQPIGPLD
jgi:hypothetical protein